MEKDFDFILPELRWVYTKYADHGLWQATYRHTNSGMNVSFLEYQFHWGYVLLPRFQSLLGPNTSRTLVNTRSSNIAEKDEILQTWLPNPVSYLQIVYARSHKLINNVSAVSLETFLAWILPKLRLFCPSSKFTKMRLKLCQHFSFYKKASLKNNILPSFWLKRNE